MSTQWRGQLFAYPQENGGYFVGITPAPGVRRDGSFRVFLGSGPSIPTGFSELLHVDNLDSWLL